MIRKGMVRGIKPECVNEYEKTHSDVWPEILQKITECNIKNYSVFAQGDRLFSFFEYHGNNYEEDTIKMRDNKIFEKWEKLHEDMFKPLEGQEFDQGWIELNEIFRKD